MKNTLWILTEERPKVEVVEQIVSIFVKDREADFSKTKVRIAPLFNSEHNFCFSYEVRGIKSSIISNIYIKIVSGNSSFCDFLIFYQEKEPIEGSEPLYVIEETKTDDSESRNTGVYQRSSKFVFVDNYFTSAKKIMLYNLQIRQKLKPTSTYIFGTRMLLTLGVRIIGKQIDPSVFIPYSSVDEFISSKSTMRSAPKGNVPIVIKKVSNNEITISGRLFKNNGLAHDPNIGALSIIAATLRKLGWNGKIVITKHGLSQSHIKSTNKFIKIALQLNIDLDGLTLPKKSRLCDNYWKYETKGEKLGTIFVHLASEFLTDAVAIFENHAGCEKGYFLKKDGTPIPLPKYTDRVAYKNGDKSKIYYIPDLVLWNKARNEIINIEGKTYENREKGIVEIDNYDSIEKDFIIPEYAPSTIKRTVVLYGEKNDNEPLHRRIGLLLTDKGRILLGPNPPSIFEDIIKRASVKDCGEEKI